MKKLLIAFFAVLILVGCSNVSNFNTNTNNQDSQMPTSDQLINSNENFEITTDNDDRAISLINKNSKEVVIEDIESVCGLALATYVWPENSDQIILKDLNLGAGYPLNRLYSLNLEDLSCQKMQTSKYVEGWGSRDLSPNKQYLAIIDQDSPKKLNVIDLVNDQVVATTTAGDNEILNGGYGEHSNRFVTEWYYNDVLAYLVFSNYNNQNQDETHAREVKEIRFLEVK